MLGLIPAAPGRPRKRKELTSRGWKYAPRFDIEGTTYEGDSYYIVRFRGAIVTTIPAQLTRQAARREAARYFWALRNAKRLAHIPTPF